jgi:hypothetical protein
VWKKKRRGIWEEKVEEKEEEEEKRRKLPPWMPRRSIIDAISTDMKRWCDDGEGGSGCFAGIFWLSPELERKQKNSEGRGAKKKKEKDETD